MICPRCQSPLEARMIGTDDRPPRTSPYRTPPDGKAPTTRRREVDRCPKCGGVWFDRGEMTEGLREIASGEVDIASWLRRAPEEEQYENDEPVLDCPRCERPMDAIRSRAVPEIIFDRCPRCQGVWFDGGELRRFAEPVAAALALVLEEFP